MAKVMTKTSLASLGNGHKQQHHHHHNSIVPKTCCIFSSDGVSSSFCTVKKRFPTLKLKPHVLGSSSLSSGLDGKNLVFLVNKELPNGGKSLFPALVMLPRFGNPQNWWEKGLRPNMREITSVQDFVDSLLNAGDKLVVVNFFSPGCGGCKALHPKICQLAEMNPEVQFLQVNHDEHKSMCYSLKVYVLPFFRFYRGAQGRLCSFSCTNATIKKFKDALTKHTPDRCSLGPTKGLEEKELIALSANKDLSFTCTPKPVQPADLPEPDDLAKAEPAPLSVESLTLPPMDPQ